MRDSSRMSGNLIIVAAFGFGLRSQARPVPLHAGVDLRHAVPHNPQGGLSLQSFSPHTK